MNEIELGQRPNELNFPNPTDSKNDQGLKEKFKKGHRRGSSVWLPPPLPISQRIIQPIQRRFDKNDTEIRYIEPNWSDTKTPRYLLRNYRSYCSNNLRTTKYTIWNFFPKNLWEQMHRYANLYFIVIVTLNWIPAVQAYSKFLGIIPVAIILGLTALKDAYEDFRRHLSDNKINNQTVYVWSSERKEFRKMPWKYIIVGDLVHVKVDETIPADLLLIRSSDPQGGVFVETSNLDGENNLKQRSVLPKCRQNCESTDFNPTNFNIKIYCNKPDPKLSYIHGSAVYGENSDDKLASKNFVIRGCQLRNTSFIEGIVLYTGKETKAALNNGKIPYKRSNLEQLTNIFVIYCVILLIILCIVCGGLSIRWNLAHDLKNKNIPFVDLYTGSPVGDGFVNMLSFIISFQSLIPLSLYITVELIKLGQIFFLNQDSDLYHEPTDTRIGCRSFTIAESLGQIQYILSDKTGTLTENKMIFKCCSINGNSHEPSISTSTSFVYNQSCHCILDVQNLSTHKNDNKDEIIEINETLKNALPRVAAFPEQDDNHRRCYYFFLNMAACNTVMVHAEREEDQLDKGRMRGDVFEVSNSAFYIRSNEYSPEDLTPVENLSPPTPSSKFSFVLTSGQDIVRRLSSFFQKKEKPLIMKKQKNSRIYEAESPDEYCLVNAAKAYGFVLNNRGIDTVEVILPVDSPTTPMDFTDEPKRKITLKIAKVLPFDANRKRMSIVFDYENRKLLLCKGADQEILQNLSTEFQESAEGKVIINNSKLQLTRYSSGGLRTLCMAMRYVSNEEYAEWLRWHEGIEDSDDNEKEIKLSESCRNLEKNMELLGLTAIEDRLQDGVPETISSLREAGIQIWILTGDKEETALNIAKSCQLFDNETGVVYLNSEEHFINVIEKTVKYNVVLSPQIVELLKDTKKNNQLVQIISRASAVLCYRMTPKQKATVVATVKKTLKGRVLAVGDGANDVPMILEADVGIGISGQEGLQAVMSSDFALARFRYLKKLLLVHGHWFYHRLSNVLLYFLCKNAMLVLIIVWAQFFSGFSANGIMDPLYMMLYPIIFTAVQPLVYGILDQDIKADNLLNQPQLYDKGRFGTIYKSTTFFLNIIDAFWQSAAIYFLSYGAYNDTTCEAWEFGFVLASALFFCNNGHLVLITRLWTWPFIFIHLFFIGVHYLFFFIYMSFSSPIFGTKSTPVQVAVNTVFTANYWSTLFLCVIVALMPRFYIKVIQNMVSPGKVYKSALEHRKNPQNQNLPS